MDFPALKKLYYHRDYDGIVAASMVQATAQARLEMVPVQYAPNLVWTERRLARGTAIVDFLFHPDADLWVDHHETTFRRESDRLAFQPDPFHTFVPTAPSCPAVIATLPWFTNTARWAGYIDWANIIDGAAYESAAQANDLCNPYVLISYIVAELADVDVLAALIRGIGNLVAEQVLALQELRAIRTKILATDASLRARFAEMLRRIGDVAVLDQSEIDGPYRRYLAYERFPDVRYGIGLYRAGEHVIVSVGENPWNRGAGIHLGDLCKEFGGGGRRSTAGVPVASVDAARQLASVIVDRLNRGE
jgi:hypothetical protein